MIRSLNKFLAETQFECNSPSHDLTRQGANFYLQTGKWENGRPVSFILNKPIWGRGWIPFLEKAECLPFVEVGDFRGTRLLAEQPEEGFRATGQNWRQRLEKYQYRP